MRHGHSKRGKRSKTYNTWRAMLQRCLQKTHDKYPRYGGRGITVCSDWRTFTNFLKDMGERPKNKTLDRINVNGHYEPSNCRWATMKQQAKNKQK